MAAVIRYCTEFSNSEIAKVAQKKIENMYPQLIVTCANNKVFFGAQSFLFALHSRGSIDDVIRDLGGSRPVQVPAC